VQQLKPPFNGSLEEMKRGFLLPLAKSIEQAWGDRVVGSGSGQCSSRFFARRITLLARGDYYRRNQLRQR